MKKFRNLFIWLSLVICVLILFLVNLSTGSTSISPQTIAGILLGYTADQSLASDIFINFRLTKAVTCVLAGSALSLGGLFMQTLFRNPLAGPDVFGLSSGASLLVALLLISGASFLQGPFALAMSASLGSCLVFILVLLASLKVRDTTSLLLIGLMIGAAISSVVSVLQFVGRSQDQHMYLVWTFGSLNALDWTELRILSLVFLAGTIPGLASLKPLNAWLLGENYAQSLGVNLSRSRLLIIVSTCILTGGVTAFCGPIAFVGIAVPHLARLFFRSTNHRILIPAVLLTGAGIMLASDLVAQWPGDARVIPINAITAMLGAPVVIWVIIRSRRIVI